MAHDHPPQKAKKKKSVKYAASVLSFADSQFTTPARKSSLLCGNKFVKETHLIFTFPDIYTHYTLKYGAVVRICPFTRGWVPLFAPYGHQRGGRTDKKNYRDNFHVSDANWIFPLLEPIIGKSQVVVSSSLL